MGKKEFTYLQSQSPNSVAFNDLQSKAHRDYTPRPLEKLTTFWNFPGISKSDSDLVNQTNQNFVFDAGLESYEQAIMFEITGDEQYAKNFEGLVRSWVSTTKDYQPRFQNAPLIWGWTLASWLKSAELLKYTYKNWDAKVEKDLLQWITDLQVEKVWEQVLQMDKFTGAHLPVGNWHTTILEAKLYLAFLRDDRDGVEYVIKYYKRMIDGVKNPDDPLESDQIYIAETGEQFETCRDLDHSNYGIGGLVQLSEALHHQGVDLYNYGPNSSRTGLPGLANVLETWAFIINNKLFPPNVKANGVIWKTDKHIFDKKFVHGEGCVLKSMGVTPGGYQIGFAHFGKRMGLQEKMPELAKIATNFPDYYYFHWGLGSLTHAGVN